MKSDNNFHNCVDWGAAFLFTARDIIRKSHIRNRVKGLRLTSGGRNHTRWVVGYAERRVAKTVSRLFFTRCNRLPDVCPVIVFCFFRRVHREPIPGVSNLWADLKICIRVMEYVSLLRNKWTRYFCRYFIVCNIYLKLQTIRSCRWIIFNFTVSYSIINQVYLLPIYGRKTCLTSDIF